MSVSSRKFRVLAALPAALALLLTLPAGGHAHQALSQAPAQDSRAQDVGSYTLFNLPTGGTADTTIEDHIVELVRGAPAGSEIHGAMYTWTRTPVAEALADAQERGVDVRLAVDSEGAGGWNSNPDNKAIQVLNDAGFTELVYCGGSDNSSCIGNRSGSINHNKNFTFSETSGMRDVVLMSSHNLTNSQTESYNNAVVVHGDAHFYDKFVQHTGNLLAQRKDTNYYENSPLGHIGSDASNAEAHFSPRADSNGGTDPEAATDTVAEILSTMNSYEDGCSVEVAQVYFTGPRAPAADELIRIGRMGCDVRVVGGAHMTDYIYNRLSGNTNVTIRRPLENLHSKYLVMRGTISGESGRGVVLAGSHNLTGPALRKHDETLLEIERAKVTSAFDENFDTLWQAAG